MQLADVRKRFSKLSLRRSPNKIVHVNPIRVYKNCSDRPCIESSGFVLLSANTDPVRALYLANSILHDVPIHGRKERMVNWGALFVEYWSTIWIAFFETFDPPEKGSEIRKREGIEETSGNLKGE